MAPSFAQFNPARLRSWFRSLPLFTRCIAVILVLVSIASLFFPWLLSNGELIPTEIGLFSAHRLNTYPVVHSGVIQLSLSLITLIPLLERFEAENGTLVCVALFTGPFSTFPGVLYILLDHVVLRQNTAIHGASIWMFLLLACESVKQYRSHPNFEIGTYKIPTWTGTILLILVVNFLIPNTTLLGHLCAAIIGYGFELGYLKFLVPPEKIIRWIETKLNPLGRLPRYVSFDQKTYGRYGLLDTRDTAEASAATARSYMSGSTQRL